MLLIRSTANRQHVVHVSDEAAAFGIRPGMTLAQARASCAHVHPIEHQPHRDEVALEAIARWLTRFSPVVSIGGETRDPNSIGNRQSQIGNAKVQSFCQGERLVLQSAAAHPRDQLRVRPDSKSAIENRQSAIYLDLTGSQYVFGSYDNILTQIHAAITRFGLRACIAVAPTVGAAYALTFKMSKPQRPRRTQRDNLSDFSVSSVVSVAPMNFIRSDSCGLVDALSDLPPATLRLDDHIVAMLTHLGITTIGLLRKLPRDQLPSRFGPTILKRLNQALGLEPEPLVPVRSVEPITAGVEFDFGVDSLESLWVVIEEQLKQVIQQLVRRGHGARVIEFDLLLQNQKPMTRTIELSRPTRDPKRIFRLVRLTLDSPLPRREGAGGGVTGLNRATRVYQATPHPTLPLKGGGKKRRVRQLFGDRFTGVRFRVTQSIRIRDEQIALLDRNDLADENALADLLERLTLRLKEDVFQTQTIESYVPERAWNINNQPQRRRDAEKKNSKLATDAHKTVPMVFSKSSVPIRAPSVVNNLVFVREDSCGFRPLTLSDQPHEIAVIVSPSHDRDGRPVAVTIDGQHHRVLHARGPERLSGEWWVGHNKTRDYFDIEIENAARLWVFRVVENGRWFVHGEY